MTQTMQLILLGTAIVALVLGIAGVGRLDIFAWVAIACVALVMLAVSGAL